MSRAAQRSPSADPQPGDRFNWHGIRTLVTRRERDAVFYTVQNIYGEPSEERHQPLAKFSAWAAQALCSGECVVLKFCCAGPCRVCRVWLDKDVHSTDEGITCAGCCEASKHK